MNSAASPQMSPPRLTAVQLRIDGELTACLLCGGPFSIVAGDEGEIALLPPGRVATYLVARRRVAGVYIFRTASGGHRTTIPGVSQPVVLLMSSSRRGLGRRIRNFIRKLTRYGHDPSELTDDFWTRAGGALLARRRPTDQLLSSLLASEAAGQGAALRGRAGHLHGDHVGGGRFAVDPELHAEPPGWRVLVAARAPGEERRVGRLLYSIERTASDRRPLSACPVPPP
jgi:hypothetical protein